MIESTQDKQKEISFFDGHAAADSYDVFTPESNLRLIRCLSPAHNAVDRVVFAPALMKPLRSFVLTYGEKP